MTQDVNVVVIDFKVNKGNEMVVANEDGSYTILINARLSYSDQLRAYEHAIRHIDHNDFEKTDVQAIEYSAHNLNPEETIPEPAQKYLERIKKLQAKQRKIKKQIEHDQMRVEFIMEHCDMFKRAEHQHLYGDDL